MTSTAKLNKHEEYLSLAGQSSIILEKLPTNKLEWIEKARPSIGKRARNFDLFPFYIEPYEDNHPNIMMVNGRQTFKTTFATDIIANTATSRDGVEVTYVADNEAHLSAFSMQRLRKETFKANPALSRFLPGQGRANIGTISLLNDSVAYLVTDEGEYSKVEGKSNVVIVLDEAQYQDIGFLPKALFSMSQTRGRLYTLGIGGEAGSPYHEMWNRTDQREWVYDDSYWRDKLEFDSAGNITNDTSSLKAILSGRWVAQKPENTQYRGYHMPQSIFPSIPATIDQAIHKYNTSPEYSIEWQQKHYPSSMFISHVLGEFFKAERRPITPEMVYACMKPYRYLSFLTGEEVRHLKSIFNNEIRVLMGVDFGSGPAASSTVISIIIHWRKSNRYQLAYVDKRPQEHQLDQARYIADLGREYEIDFGVGDLGYGAIQVKVIADGGRDSRDAKFDGLGRARFKGCRTIGDETKPNMEYKTETDEHGTETGRLQIDKTTSIQAFIDRVGQYTSHPIRRSEENCKRPIIMIPYQKDYETDWLVKEFCSITRKDLEKDPEIAVEDPRQKAVKTFNHPSDAVMSIIYCFTADEQYRENSMRILGIGRR